jgi:hypothetical protein
MSIPLTQASDIQTNAILGLLVTSVAGIIGAAVTVLVKRLRRSDCCGMKMELASPIITPQVSSNIQMTTTTQQDPQNNQQHDVITVHEV